MAQCLDTSDVLLWLGLSERTEVQPDRLHFVVLDPFAHGRCIVLGRPDFKGFIVPVEAAEGGAAAAGTDESSAVSRGQNLTRRVSLEEGVIQMGDAVRSSLLSVRMLICPPVSLSNHPAHRAPLVSKGTPFRNDARDAVRLMQFL